MIPIYKPYLPPKSVEYAKDAIDSTWISSLGEYVDRATDSLREFMGCQYAILINNGTSATHLVTKSLHRFNPTTKRILVPSACYVAAYNSLLYDNFGWDVECVDLDPETWNMRIDAVREGDVIYAVHNLGNIINVKDLKRKYGCTIIEDNCEGLFGSYEGVSSGTESLCSAMSFFGNKNITCGEGGAFMTNDKDIFDYVTKVKGQGQTAKRYVHDVLGYNYRMTNIQAAILLGQLEDIQYIRSNKKRVFDRYKSNLSSIDGISLQKEEPNTSHSMWMFGVFFHNLLSYDHAHAYFSARGIETRPMFYPYTAHTHLNFTGQSVVADTINKSVVVFPSYGELPNEQVDYVCEQIISFAQTLEKRIETV
jgi:perosamine synthetase